MKHILSVCCLLTAFALFNVTALAGTDLETRVEHGYADSNGVKIHYASLGKGPLVVMIHGFPDFWYSWRDQMEALSKNYQVVAIDLRARKAMGFGSVGAGPDGIGYSPLVRH